MLDDWFTCTKRLRIARLLPAGFHEVRVVLALFTMLRLSGTLLYILQHLTVFTRHFGGRPCQHRVEGVPLHDGCTAFSLGEPRVGS